MSDVTTTPPPAPPRRGRRRLLLAVALLALLGGGGFAAVTFLGTGETDPDVAAPTEAPVEGEIVEIATLTTNLAGDGGRLARVGFAAVLADGLTAETVTPRFALVRDAALREIAEMTADELRTPAGQDRLRERLTAAAIAQYPDGEVLRIVLTELIVQ